MIPHNERFSYATAVLFFSFLVALFAGCSRQDSIPSDVLIIAQSAEPRSLDPHVATGNLDFRICNQIYEGLVRFASGSLEIEPALAKNWSVSPDGKIYTFQLRDDVRFQDGSVFNAEAVKFNFDRMLDPSHPYNDTGPFPLSFFFSQVSEVVVVNEYRVKFVLKSSYAPFLANLAYPVGFIVSPAAVRKYESDYGRHPCGTGPFKFAEWESQESVKLVPNKDYHTSIEFPLREIYFRPVSDENTRITELMSGGVDVVLEVPSDMLQFFRNSRQLKVKSSNGPHLWFLILNTKFPPFNDRRARQAVNYAIDKKAIVENLLQNTATIPNGPVPEAFAWAYDAQLEPYLYNPEKARNLIRAAGAEGSSITLLATEGGSGMLAPKAMAVAIQSYLNEVGFDVSIELFEWNSYLAKVNAGLDEDSHMAEMAWMTNDPDTLPYLALRTAAQPSQGGFNSGYYSNPELDDLLENARNEINPEKRANLYHKVQKIVHTDAPWAFIASWKQVAVCQETVKGFELQPTFLFNLIEVRKERED